LRSDDALDKLFGDAFDTIDGRYDWPSDEWLVSTNPSKIVKLRTIFVFHPSNPWEDLRGMVESWVDDEWA